MEEAKVEETRDGPPWEDRGAHGVLVAFARTCEGSALKPTDFFRSMRLTGNVLDAALYGIGIVAITALFQLLWAALLIPIPFVLIGNLGGISASKIAAIVALSWVRLILSPILAAFAFLVLSGLIHLGLTLLGEARHPFETTFRILCYAATPLLLSLVPFCGEPIGKIWTLVILIIGIKECYGTSIGSAIVAVLLPAIAFFGCCGLLIGIPMIGKAF